MAFMMPVVRKDWDVYGKNRQRRCSTGTCAARQSISCPRTQQGSECPSESGSFSTSPYACELPAGRPGFRRNRSMVLEIRAQQRHRLSVSSLPSSFHSGHLSLPLNSGSPAYSRPKSTTPRIAISSKALQGRFKTPSSEPPSPGKAQISSPRSSDDSSPPKEGNSQNYFQKFHVRLVDRLRRSFRLSCDEGAIANDAGSRASS